MGLKSVPITWAEGCSLSSSAKKTRSNQTDSIGVFISLLGEVNGPYSCTGPQI